MIEFLPYVAVITTAVLGSNWVGYLVRRRLEKKDDRTKLLLGLCHDRIFYLGSTYLNRPNGGWMTRDEYENLIRYLSTPYYSLGGNGVVKSIVDKCSTLPIKRVQDLTSEDLAIIAGSQERGDSQCPYNPVCLRFSEST